MNNRIKMTDSKFKCNIFLFLSVTVFMARLSICVYTYIPLMLYPRKGSRGISDIPPRRPRFSKIIYL
jgi:hypothetical protein